MTRFRLTVGIALAIAFNLLFLALYLWSRPGQDSTVSVEARGSAYRAVIDGTQSTPSNVDNLPFDAQLQSPASGSISFLLPYGMPSLPGPRGIDSIVVTDPMGKELFRDDFNFFDTEKWRVVSGGLEAHDGVLVATGKDVHAVAILRNANWTDFTVTFRFRNGTSGLIGVRSDEAGNGVFYAFELQRDFPNFLRAVDNGVDTGSVYGGLIKTSKPETLRSLAAMAVGFYPALLLLLAVALALALALAYAPRIDLEALRRRAPDLPFDRLPVSPYLVAAVALGLVALGTTLYLNEHYYGAVPHLPDEVAYMFQARLLSSGHFNSVIPPASESFFFYYPNFLFQYPDGWGSFYPYGHPVALSIGAFFGTITLVPSLIGGGCVVLLYLVGRRLYSDRVALLATLLFAASPFFLMQASSFMSHNTGVFYMLLALLFILKRERPLLYGLIGGLAFGLFLNTRPLTAFAVAPAFGAVMLTYLRPLEDRLPAAKQIAAFAAGAIVTGAIGYLLYNYGLTGDPLSSAYSDPSAQLGFSNGHTVAVGLRNEQAQLAALLLVLHAWPKTIGLLLVALPFALGTRNRWDYFCAAAALVPIALYVLYRYNGVYEGPRYWYEVMPFVLLLTARGVESLAAAVASFATAISARLGRYNWPVVWPAFAASYLGVAVLVVYGTGGWLFGKWEPSWNELNVPLVPESPAAMRHLFGVDNRLDVLAGNKELHYALVLVRPCGFFQSNNCYGSVFLKNSLDFNGDVVWARYIPGRAHEVIEAYPGRKVYIATWDGVPSIEPYDPRVDP